MSTQRYVSTSFWTDKWVRSLDPAERYLYIYLLTNPETNIAGVYDITIDRIAFDTGYDERTLRPMFDRFAEAGKAYYVDEEWIIIPSWPRHQKIKRRDSNIARGINAILLDLPDNVWEFLRDIGYQYEYLEELGRPFEGLRGPSRPSNYSDSDSDSDLDRDRDLDSSIASPPAPRPEPKPLSPMQDELAQAYQSAFVSEVPAESWQSIPKERKQLTKLAKLTRSLASVTEMSPQSVASAVLAQYAHMRTHGRGEFWRRAPWVPSALVARWDQVVEALRQRWESEQEANMSYEEILF